MVRVISQETYNEVVKENIQEFDMTPEEAVSEAVAQFEAQGVDLSNIIKDLTLGHGDLISKTIKSLEALIGEKGSDELLIKELIVLKTECNKDIAHKVKAGKEGAYDILIRIIENEKHCFPEQNNAKKIISVLDTLMALMDSQPDLLDARGANLIKGLLDDIHNEEILIATLKWTSTCCIKHEINRQKLFSKNIGENLKRLLLHKNTRVLSESLQVIRKMTLDDDIRVEFGKAHEHARDLGVLTLETLTKLMQENVKPPLVSDIMLTIATLLVRHELCSVVADNGIGTIFNVLTDNYDSVNVIQQAIKLITALAGNDDVKRQLVKSGIVPVIVSLLTRHSGNPTATSLTLKCIAALTLREPEHSLQFFETGAPEAIVECMKIYPDNAAVQKNACWAIRNMVARCREHNSKFHELDVEALLNRSFGKFGQEFGYDIKSALRDLECDVKLDEQWTGKGGEIEK